MPLDSTPAPSPPTVAPLQVGLIGFGYAGRSLHAPLIQASPDLSLAAVSSRQADAVHADCGAGVRVVGSPEALATDPALDLVVIASPNHSHARLAALALSSGHHVLIDKPFALTAAEAAPLLALAEQHQRVLSVFHNRRWDADFLTAQALLATGDAGPLGRLTDARLCFDRFRPVVRARWREGDGPGAGLWLDLGPHLIDQALRLFGMPLALQADITRQRPGGLSDDAFECRLRYANGLRVTLAASMLAALPGPRFALHGLRGSWVKQGLDAQEDALKAGSRPDPQQPQAWGHDPQAGRLCVLPASAASLAAGGAGDATPGVDLPIAQAHPNLPGRWPDFYPQLAAAIRGQGPNPVPAAQALQVMAMLDLGRASHQQRRELTVQPA